MTHLSAPQSDDLLDRRLTHALEAAPRFTVPGDFAFRTALLVQTQALSYPLPVATPRFSRLSIQVALAVLILAMLVLPTVAGQNSSFSIRSEVLFALELAALTTWLSLRRAPLF